MASRAISRVLLILALVVTAHAFKPISGGSLIEQLLSAAESLSFVLPDFAEVRIAQASYLAAAFGQRTERRDGSTTTVSMPAVLGFGQTASRAVTPCNESEVAPTLAKARPVRLLIARTQPRLKRHIPELPKVMPFARALAMTLPLAEVELISTPVHRSAERQLLRRTLFMPASIQPMLLRRPTAKIECDAATVVAIESLTELSQNEGPKEEEFELEMWEMDVPVQAIESAETEPAANPAARNCPVALPETAMPPQPLEIAPPQ